MTTRNRRQFLRSAALLFGATALAGSTACSGGASEPAQPKPAPKPEAKAAEAPKPAAPPKPAEPVKLTVDDPIATQLKYVEDASTVDKAANATFKEGSRCSNCMLFQAGADEEWGPCTLFANKLVKGEGWCASWAPKA